MLSKHISLWIEHIERRCKWKVVGGDDGFAASPELCHGKRERRLEVEMIERHEGEDTRIGARKAPDMLGTEGFELLAKKSCGESAGPFVKVAKHEPRMMASCPAEDAFPDQALSLMPPLQIAGAQVDVEDAEDAIVRQVNVGLKYASFLTASMGKVVVPPAADGKPGQRHIPIGSAVQGAIPSEGPCVIGELCADLFGLIELRRSERGVDHLLQAYDICI